MAMTAPDPSAVYYPESDGQPMADNEAQLLLMIALIVGYRRLYAGRGDIHVAGNLFWYPVEGQPRIVAAPDLMIIPGCGPAPLRSYRQWEHGGQPSLVIELLSESNTAQEMFDKLAFYDEHGASEHLVFDTVRGGLWVWERRGDHLVHVIVPDAWVSPSTGVSFRADGLELIAIDPLGRRFEPPEDALARAEVEAEALRSRADAEAARAEAEAARADRLAAALRAAGIDPDTLA
ncbi:MAG: Uma2 family endonuclease [Acidimicrobiales bacterium]